MKHSIGVATLIVCSCQATQKSIVEDNGEVFVIEDKYSDLPDLATIESIKPNLGTMPWDMIPNKSQKKKRKQQRHI